jgi:hypothetical protein
VEELQRIMAQIRVEWPHVKITVRGDSGFCRDEIMTWCEANAIDYVFGFAKNERLKAIIAAELQQAAVAVPLSIRTERFLRGTWPPEQAGG